MRRPRFGSLICAYGILIADAFFKRGWQPVDVGKGSVWCSVAYQGLEPPQAIGCENERAGAINPVGPALRQKMAQ